MYNKLYILILFVLSTHLTVFSRQIDENSDTITILLKTEDTSFYADANISGLVYKFMDIKDTLYLRLTYSVSGYDMGVANLNPHYSFKSTAPEAVYKIIFTYTGRALSWAKIRGPDIIRICNCESLHAQYFSDEKPIRYVYKNEKDNYFGKCLTFYNNGIKREEKTHYNGLIAYEESWYENGALASQVEYKPNSNNIAYGYWYFKDRSVRSNTQDTLVIETYPDGSRKSISRFTLFPRNQIEYMFWSPTKKLLKHWKIVDGKKIMVLNITDTIIEKGGNLIYVETQTCDSMSISDSLVKRNGFNVASKVNRPYYAIYLKALGTIDKNGFLYAGKYFIYDCKGKMIKYLIFSHGKFWGEVKIE